MLPDNTGGLWGFFVILVGRFIISVAEWIPLVVNSILLPHLRACHLDFGILKMSGGETESWTLNATLERWRSWYMSFSSPELPRDTCLQWRLLTCMCCTVALYFTIHIDLQKTKNRSNMPLNTWLLLCFMWLWEWAYLIQRPLQLNVWVALREEKQKEEECSGGAFKTARFVSKVRGENSQYLYQSNAEKKW